MMCGMLGFLVPIVEDAKQSTAMQKFVVSGDVGCLCTVLKPKIGTLQIRRDGGVHNERITEGATERTETVLACWCCAGIQSMPSSVYASVMEENLRLVEKIRLLDPAYFKCALDPDLSDNIFYTAWAVIPICASTSARHMTLLHRLSKPPKNTISTFAFAELLIPDPIINISIPAFPPQSTHTTCLANRLELLYDFTTMWSNSTHDPPHTFHRRQVLSAAGGGLRSAVQLQGAAHGDLQQQQRQ